MGFTAKRKTKHRVLFSLITVFFTLLFVFVIRTCADEENNNSVVPANFTGLAQDDNGEWCYWKSGEIDTTYSNLINYGGSWFYVRNGKIDWNYETLAQVNGSGVWYYVKDGKLDWSYTGLAKYYSTWYYIDHGRLNWNYTGLTYYYGTWYYVRNGVLDWGFNGLTFYSGGWFYVKDGRIDWSYSNLVPYYGSWFYVHNGQIDWNYDTLSQVNGSGVWYYVKGGKLDWNYTGLAKYYSTWYYIEKGRLNWNFNGMGYYGGGWFYIHGGRLDWGYTGWCSSNGAQFFVENGRAVSNTWKEKDGTKYYFGKTGYMTTETATINGRLEVFRMDGRWIDTTSMDSKASFYSSKTNYLILVDLNNRVTKVYQKSGGKWTPKQLYLCTVGDNSKGWDTVKGDFYIGYSSWGNPITRGYSFQDTDNHTLYYWVRFCDSFLFHSQLYNLNTYNLTPSGNALGEALSHGCVRLRFNNAKWMYDNIPDGTRVLVY